MEHFFIVTNDGKDKGQKVTDEVIRILASAGKRCTRCLKDESKKIVKASVPDTFDCAVVIGGDGTLIEAARALYGRDIPILGINMGTLGYLAEVEVSHIGEALENLLLGRYEVENRMMLEGTFGGMRKDVSLNDIVVARSGSLRLIHFKLYVNGELLNSYEADGVIISTPTGSTAYNLSAGGPIVEPTAEMIVITPICSHALNTSSIVLSAEDELVIEIGEGKHSVAEEACIAFDGTDTVAMTTGDRVTVRRACASAKIIKLSKVSFLETLRRKMKGN
ncbi:MAG TPA: NAD(+) kinase [Lachnospiraceae bacterium]|nr:NAD(+) kinase [Lachnospiraceae bacterium]